MPARGSISRIVHDPSAPIRPVVHYSSSLSPPSSAPLRTVSNYSASISKPAQRLSLLSSSIRPAPPSRSVLGSQSRFKSGSKAMDASNSPLKGLYQPTQLSKLFYGPGIVAEKLSSCLPTSSSKAFIITGSSLATKTPVVKEVEKALGSHHAGTFSNIKQHAPVADIDEATDKVLSDPAIDTLVSIGGGSPIDSAKLISHRFHEKGGGKYLWHVAIPTTLSAAECSGLAGYSDSKGNKTAVGAPELVPQVVLYDASFIDPHTPAQLFTSTGMRALDHALELLYHPTASDLTKTITVAAAHDLFEYLPRYKADPSDRHAITKLQLAAFASLGLLGTNLKGGLGLSHALGYALGSPYGIPHGVTSCLTLGKVVQLKAKSDPEAAGQLARAYTAVTGKQRSGDDRADAVAVGKAVEDLVQRLGLKTDLGAYKVGKDQKDVVVQTATRTKEGKVYDAVAELVESLW